MKKYLYILIFTFAVSLSFTFAYEKEAGDFTGDNFVKEINKIRKENKLGELKENKELNKIAKERLSDMIKNNYFSHKSESGKDADTLLKNSNYIHKYRGENLAYGEYVDEKDVVDAWLKSKWHKYNLLYKSFDDIGIAYDVTEYMGSKYLIVVNIYGSEVRI